ncbi:FeoB-associated Cys-rich membrane protein [Fibrobacter sp. UWOS]|uniref:FeoB-associated Cys-rich membrane protein n=1 Tax=uncultured Fibrobacter sp. TaxID=261512 RepID=UPI0009F893AF
MRHSLDCRMERKNIPFCNRILMNFWDILILFIIAAACVWAIRKIVKNRKNGKTCCGNCSRCAQNCRNRKN